MNISLDPQPKKIDRLTLRRIVAAVLVRAVMDCLEDNELNRTSARSWLENTGRGWADTLGIDLPDLDSARKIALRRW
ncbi:MAG: hypothetical protein ACYC3H_05195 [Bellilinea sp.]